MLLETVHIAKLMLSVAALGSQIDIVIGAVQHIEAVRERRISVTDATVIGLGEGDGTRVELRHYVANEGVAQLLLTAWYETWGQLRKHVLAKYGS
jgi:hypothetical protein